MSAKISLAVSAAVALIAGVFCASSAGAQGASASSLADQLKAQYKLAKIVPESNSYKVAEPGTMLVIQKDGIFGVPLGNNSADPVIYAIHKDADLHRSTPGANAWKFVVGHKVYLSKVDVDSKHEKVFFTIVECDSSNPAKPTYYKSVVDFEFPNGYLAAAEAEQVESVISQVLTIDNGSDRGSKGSEGTHRNDDLIKMVQAKLPDSVLIAKIRSSKSEFDMSPDALIDLKRAGASDAVLEAVTAGLGADSNSPGGSAQPTLTGEAAPSDPSALSFSSLSQYLNTRWPDRLQSPPLCTTRLLQRLQNAGYRTITDLDTALSNGSQELAEAEAQGLNEGGIHRPCGLVNKALQATDPKFRAAREEGAALPATAPTVSECADYDACVKSGNTLLAGGLSDQSLAKFQGASQLDPSKGEAWAGIGNAYFQKGQYDDAVGMWDKALQLGSTVSIAVCHAGMLCSDIGNFLLSVKEVSFVNKKGQKEFAAAPSAVSSEGAVLFSGGNAYYLQIHFGKNWRFYYTPRNERGALCLVCPEPGPTQQKVFADYIHKALVRMAAGDFASQPNKP